MRTKHVLSAVLAGLLFSAPAAATITSTTTRNNYTGNGAADTYSFTFRILDEEDLRVTVRDSEDVETTLELDVDYSVTGVDDEDGGSIALIDADQAWLDSDGDLKSGYALTIRRVRDLLQETDIRNQGSFFPEIHEDAFDHAVMLDQQQQDEIDRALKLPETEAGSAAATSLPNAADRAGKYFAFDEDGNPIASASTVGTSTIPVSAFMETVLDDATAAAARSTLGAASQTEADGLLPKDGSEAMTGALAMGSNKITGITAGTATGEAITWDQGIWEAGDIKWSGRSTPSTGWLLCDGSAVSRTTYATLFSAIGTTFGSGDGSTTFNVPDLKGRAPMGAGAGTGLTTRTQGTKTGAETAAIPNHQHEFASDSATGGQGGSSVGGKFGGGDQTYMFQINGGAQTWQRLRWHTNSDGGGGTVAIVQPSLVLNAFIKY